MDMFDSQDWILLAGGVVLILVIAFFALFLSHRSEKERMRRTVRRQFDGVPMRAITANAYFRGMERDWDGQWRGRGILMLTEERLYFRLQKRNLDLSIPVSRIEDVKVVTGASGLRCLRSSCLQVAYRGVDRELRLATWLVRNPPRWTQLLREMLEKDAHDEKAEAKHLP